MTTQTKKTALSHFFVNLALVVGSVLLFFLAFPNPFSEKGIPFARWIGYIPIFLLIYRTKPSFCFAWGALYGALSMFLFNYWLTAFHLAAGIFTFSYYALLYALFFTILKAAVLFFPRKSYLLQWALWIAFEYIRTLGFLGYPYGITGYSQWTLTTLIKIADLGGVWIVSALMIFPQAFTASLIATRWNTRDSEPTPKVSIAETGQYRIKKPNLAFSRRIRPLFVWIVALVFALIYGFTSKTDCSGAKKIKVALVQVNSDPWKSSIQEFRKELGVLQRLSDLALSEVPPPELVVWSETAFVPSLDFHRRYRIDADSSALVLEADAYLTRQSVPFVVGNDEKRYVRDPAGAQRVADYNSALLYADGRRVQHYYKMRLVPFSEYFPYERLFPQVHQFMESLVTFFWDEGAVPTVFEAAGIKFATPICFEDTFGYISREFTVDGAELIVNMSNDSWSHSLPCQNQHFAMSVFRAVENKRSVVRATTSGQTAAIDPNGAVLALAPPFIETTISAEVPVMTGSTLYTKIGDILPLIFCIFSGLGLIIGAARSIIFKSMKGRTQ
jgi:apolipoprotein N-acyltransferase